MAVFGRLRISTLVSVTVPPAGVTGFTLGDSVGYMQGQWRVNAECNAKGKEPVPLADTVQPGSLASREYRTVGLSAPGK